MLGLAAPAFAAQPKTPAPPNTSAQHAPNPGLPANVKPIDPPVVPKPEETSQARPSTKVVAESAALTQAKKTGKPVLVDQDTTSTSEVDANPNGTFTMRSTAVPTRTRVNGKWAPIDTTLHANPDGSIAPNATDDQVRFSGGGNQSMVALTNGVSQVTIAWPGALPKPRLSGDTATYPDVLPGVDLQLTAEPSNFREALIIHDATAAANPALRAIHLAIAGTGLALGADAQGELTATDAHGNAALAMSAPMMWDSTTGPGGADRPTVTDPGAGHVSRLGVATSVAPGVRANAITDTTRSSANVALTLPPPSLNRRSKN